MNDKDLDLLKEFERLVSEGGTSLEIELESRYNCDRGHHKWLLYNGFREKYHYCDLCDLKDTKLPILK